MGFSLSELGLAGCLTLLFLPSWLSSRMEVLLPEKWLSLFVYVHGVRAVTSQGSRVKGPSTKAGSLFPFPTSAQLVCALSSTVTRPGGSHVVVGNEFGVGVGGTRGGSYIRDCILGFSGLPEAALAEPPRFQCSEFIFLTYGMAGL